MSKLGQRILLKKYQGVKLPNGKTFEHWTCCQTVDGKIECLSGPALEAAKLISHKATTAITISKFKDVARNWLAVWRMTAYRVVAVKPGLEAGTMILYCREAVI